MDNGDETEIDGATSSTYMPVAEDGGKSLRVVVSFSDNDEFAEGPLTSAPALVNRPAEGAPLISTMGLGAQIFAESMTVGGTGRLGYSDAEYGVLITSFNADSVTYNLGELRWDGNDPGILTFGLDKELPGSFVLTAGTATFSSAAAFRNADDGNEIYRWNTSGDISWMNGDTVPVALNRTAPPVVGQTLPVDLSGISDADGLTTLSYSFQWVRVDGEDETDIPGAMSQTYTPVAADAGKALKVKVSFSDDQGFAEEVVSDATPLVNSPAMGAPAIQAGTGLLTTSLTVGADGTLLGYSTTQGSLGANTFTLGGDHYTISKLQWDGTAQGNLLFTLAKEIPQSFVLQTGDAVFHSDDATPISGTNFHTYSWSTGGALTWADLDTVAITLTVPGQETPQVGRRFFVDLSNITDANGLTDTSYTYQWVRDDNGDETVIDGEAASTYAAVAEDAGKSIKVRVSFSDDDSFDEQRTSAPARINGPAEGAPAIFSGDEFWTATLTVQQALGGFGYTDGFGGSLSPNTFTLGGITYTVDTILWDGLNGLLRFDLDKPLPDAVVLTAGNWAFSPGDATKSTPGLRHRFEWAAAGRIPWSIGDTAPVALIALADGPAVGTTSYVNLSGISDANGFFDASYTYQWVLVEGMTETDIASATSGTHTPVAADTGKALKVKVSLTDDHGYAEGPLVSAASALVNSPVMGLPEITGTPGLGNTLTADTSNVSDANGPATLTFSYQWVRITGGVEADITGAISSTYTLVAADVGASIALKVRVSFTDSDSFAEVVESEPISTNALPTGQPTLTLGETEVWNPTLTVGVSGLAQGYNAGINAAGSVTTDMFTVDGATYTVNRLSLTISTIGFIVDKELPHPFTLTLDSLTLSSADAPTQWYKEGFGYFWSVTGLSWSNDDSVAVSLKVSERPRLVVGETLQADTSSIDDADGISGAPFDYQWVQVVGMTETAITGATNDSYTLVAADTGKSIKLRVSFTDDGGTAEQVESELLQPNTAATGAPTLGGTAQVGEALTVNATGITDADGVPTETRAFAFQWFWSDGIIEIKVPSATAPAYHPTSVDAGKNAKAHVWFRDGEGYWEGPLTSAASGLLQNDTSVRLLWRGRLVVGGSETGARGFGIWDGDPLRDDKFRRAGKISLIDAVTLDPGAGVGGKDIIKLSVSLPTVDTGVREHWRLLIDDHELSLADGVLSLVGARTIAQEVTITWEIDPATSPDWQIGQHVALALKSLNQAPTSKPTLTGNVEPNQTLTVDASSIVDPNGLSAARFGYQWVRVLGETETNIPGATATTYVVPAAHADQSFKARVSYTDDDGFAETIETRLAGPNVGPIGAPTISGAVAANETLTADISDIRDDNGLENVTFSYQWILVVDTTETEISGANTASYTIPAADASKSFKVRVSYTDNGGGSEQIESQTIAPQSAATGLPSVAGTPQVGLALTADISAIADANGLPTDPTAYSYQWVLVDNNVDSDISWAIGPAYHPSSAEVGKAFKVKVSFTDRHGYSEGPITSAASNVVQADSAEKILWRATMKAGSGGIDYFGYEEEAENYPGGTLSQKTFDRGSTTYTINVWELTEHIGSDSDRVRLGLRAAQGSIMGTAWSLFVDGFELTLADGVKTEFSFGAHVIHAVSWEIPQALIPDWQVGRQVALALRATNMPPSSNPSVTGSVSAGTTLTVDPGSIDDPNGVASASFSYQWKRRDCSASTDDGDIASATRLLLHRRRHRPDLYAQRHQSATTTTTASPSRSRSTPSTSRPP